MKISKKPLYNIGDIVIYRDRKRDKEIETEKNGDGLARLIQSRVVGAWALKDESDVSDTWSWFYLTQETEDEDTDGLDEEDILCKI